MRSNEARRDDSPMPLTLDEVKEALRIGARDRAEAEKMLKRSPRR